MGPDNGRPGGAGAPPAAPQPSPRYYLAAEVAVKLPRNVWINFLGWAHGGDYIPGNVPWIDQMVSAVTKEITRQ